MSRIAKLPISIPINITIKLNYPIIQIIGNNIILKHIINSAVEVTYEKNHLFCKSKHQNNKNGWIQAGTTRSLLNNMIIGINIGFYKKLQLVGIGYRVYYKDNIINLSLGFSHIIKYKLPKGITAICPNQNEIIIKGYDKQLVGQVAANIRSYKCPEPYKGKGIRYIDNYKELILIKETKKK